MMDSFLVIAVPIASMPSGPTMEPFSQRLEVPEATQRGINDGTVWLCSGRKKKSTSRLTVARLISNTRRAYRLDVQHFMRTLGITTPAGLRQADHKAVIAWDRGQAPADASANPFRP
jgi:hypothetical protein